MATDATRPSPEPLFTTSASNDFACNGAATSPPRRPSCTLPTAQSTVGSVGATGVTPTAAFGEQRGWAEAFEFFGQEMPGDVWSRKELGKSDLVHKSSARRCFVPVLAAAVVVSLVTGCDGSSGQSASKPTTTVKPHAATTVAPSTTVDPDAKDKAEITGLYKGWVELDRSIFARHVGTLDNKQIDDYLTGPQLQHTAEVAREHERLGKSVRYPQPSALRSDVLHITVDGDSAVLVTCEVDDAIVSSADGAVLNDNVTTFESRWNVVRQGDLGWRLRSSTTLKKLSGAQACE